MRTWSLACMVLLSGCLVEPTDPVSPTPLPVQDDGFLYIGHGYYWTNDFSLTICDVAHADLHFDDKNRTFRSTSPEIQEALRAAQLMVRTKDGRVTCSANQNYLRLDNGTVVQITLDGVRSVPPGGFPLFGDFEAHGNDTIMLRLENGTVHWLSPGEYHASPNQTGDETREFGNHGRARLAP